MKLARELCNFRISVVCGIVALSLLANLHPAGALVAIGAWVCFLLLIMTYLFDIAYHSVGRSKVSTTSLFATLVRPLRNKRLEGCLGVRQTFRFLCRLLIPRGISTIRYDGFEFDIDRRCYPKLLVWNGSKHLPAVTRAFRDMIEPGMTVLDLGAAVGWYTLPAARLVGPNGRIYAFEPSPEAFGLLKRNIERAGLRNVIPVNRAVSDITGITRLYLSRSNPLHNSLGKGRTGHNFIEVPTVTLDEFLEDTRTDVIKMNIEGAEPLALRGMTKVIENSPGLRMVVEFDPSALRGLSLSEEQYMYALLENFDLQLISTKSGKLIPFEHLKQLRQELTHVGGTAYLTCRRRN